MIIDFHTHSFPAQLIPKIKKLYGERGWGSSDGTVAGLESAMKAEGVEESVILNLVTSPASQRSVNRYALEVRRPGLVSFGSIHPYAEGALEELDFLHEAGVPGIKLHPSDQGYSIDDPRCAPLFKRIGELGFIALFHIDSPVLGPSRKCLPAAFAKVVELFKGSPVICAHMGSVMRAEEEGFQLLTSLPIYMDTALSSLRPDPRELGRMIEAIGVQRVLFGSDLPWTHLDKEIAAVKESGLGREELDAVFWKNAQRLLGQGKAAGSYERRASRG